MARRFFLWHSKAVEETVQIGAQHVASYHRVAVEDKIGLDVCFSGGVVQDGISVAFDPFSGIFGQVEALSSL